MAHLCLTPGSLRWTNGGGVKVVGLGIDAALSGTTSDDPALTDTWGLGKLLYAALTAHWPGEGWPALPPAPQSPDGRPCSPRQVRAGVPSAVDDITCQALFQSGRGPAVTTSAALAGALSRVIPAPVAPPPAVPQYRQVDQDWDETPPGGQTGRPYWQLAPEPPRREQRPASPGRPALLAAVARAPAAGSSARPAPPGRRPRASGPCSASGRCWSWCWWGSVWIPRAPRLPGHGGPPPTHSASSASSSASVLRPASANGFDALSSPSDDPGNENDQLANLAIDGNPSTSWNTQFYIGNPVFGGTKTGTGLILDMGRQVRLSSVRVTFGFIPGADVQIMLGNDNTRTPSALDSFNTVARGTDLAGTHTFTVTSRATGRYVLIWFTKLPPQSAGSSNRFEAKIYNVVVRGSR